MDKQIAKMPNQVTPSGGSPDRQRRWGRQLATRTLSKAWHGNIFSEAAEAAFWQTLSLPPLLLGLLGSLGYLGDLFGTRLVDTVNDRIITMCRAIFSRNVVDTIIQPTVTDILTNARAEVASFGFLLSLWAGSSAIASFVDAITVAYDQYGERHEVWQRIVALLLYLVGLVLAVIALPALAFGPNMLPKLLPAPWQPIASTLVQILYYPVLALVLVLALGTLYKVAPDGTLTWAQPVLG